MKDLIYGKDETPGIVSIEVDGDNVSLIDNKGGITTRPATFWAVFRDKLSEKMSTCAGNNYYNYLVEYESQERWREVLDNAKTKGYEHFAVKTPSDQCMMREGYGYFKGLKVSDVSVLSFDIEDTYGLSRDPNGKILLISNTFRGIDSQLYRKLFSIDSYPSEGSMLKAWCEWVRQMNPSIIVGHNLYGYDFPTLLMAAKKSGVKLNLGRNGEALYQSKRPSFFRKDGSQSYEFYNVRIWGREIVDTFFLSIKYDVGRNYPSYKLKEIIKHEGLEKADRQHYDGALIAKLHNDPFEWEKIKKYAEHDADDALALYDLMIPAFFYYAQHIPRRFQELINTATGSQINAYMVRAYIQNGMGLPKASEAVQYEGAISFGNPGIYKNVYKVDVASLYPSIMRHHKIYDKVKDPNAYFLESVNFFTEERLNNKRLSKETGDRYYKDLEQSQKIVINSMYGFLGATGLIFNSPDNAALVTRLGRETLEKGLGWAKGKGYEVVNADTDSFIYKPPKAFRKGEFEADIAALNASFPSMIRWEDDGYYKAALIVKAKNYCLEDKDGELTIKGSGLKGTMKEPALRAFMDRVVGVLLKGHKDQVFSIYHQFAVQAANVRDIDQWCFKKTVTKALLTSSRSNEARVRECLKPGVQEGDKVYLFFKTPTQYSLLEDFDGTYDVPTLHGKLYSTLEIFDTILDLGMIPDYSLKRNQGLLEASLSQVA